MSQPILPLNPFFVSPQARVFSTFSYWPYCPADQWTGFLRDTDYVLLVDGNPYWGAPEGYWRATVGDRNPDNFIFLSGTEQAHKIRLDLGLRSHLISNNCVVNENQFYYEPAERRYDAIYTARAVTFKRIGLSRRVQNLALVVNRWSTTKYTRQDKAYETIPVSYLNERPLNNEEMRVLYNASGCGLILSPVEGACFVVAEYLLSGLPVVSTKPEDERGLGGRELWLNVHNCIYVDPDPSAVAAAVRRWLARPVDRAAVRAWCVGEMHRQRRYIATEVLQPIFDRHGVSADPVRLMFEDCWDASSPFRHRLAVENKGIPLSDAVAMLKG